MSEFEWNAKDADSVILPYQPRTAVYHTREGGICIRQEKDAYEEDDPQLLLTPQGALAVAWALIEESHLIGLPEPSLSLMEESPNWPPVTKRFDSPGTMRPRFADGPEPDGDEPSRDPASEPGPLLKAMQAEPANDPKAGSKTA